MQGQEESRCLPWPVPWPCPEAGLPVASSTYIENMSVLGRMAGMHSAVTVPCPALSCSVAQACCNEAQPCALVQLGPGDSTQGGKECIPRAGAA
jgi:hypothetical protein